MKILKHINLIKHQILVKYVVAIGENNSYWLSDLGVEGLNCIFAYRWMIIPNNSGNKL